MPSKIKNAIELLPTERGDVAPLREELTAIRRRCAQLKVLDRRSADEILGYDEHGLPR